MTDTFQELVRGVEIGPAYAFGLSFLLYLFGVLLPCCGLLYLVYFLLTLPMRRNERARQVIDLLELGLKEGRTAENVLVDVSSSRDPTLGARFHLLAAYLEQGQRLSGALDAVPRLLPPQVTAMLRTGERIGSIAKVLPACRHLLRDSVSQVRSAMNYLAMLALIVSPATIAIPLIVKVKVLPQFRMVFEAMLQEGALPALTQFVFDANGVFVTIQIAIMAFIWLATLAYLGGPRLRFWISCAAPGIPDRILFWLPWRRKRLQRDFSAMLALLLDAGVPENEAVRLAGESTANAVMQARAEAVRERLKQGTALPEAIRAMDDSGEWHWRLGNALRRTGFVRALAGWHDALDAKAFQLEQTAAQVTTAVFVLINGAIVSCIVIGMFIVLIHLLNQATLW